MLRLNRRPLSLLIAAALSPLALVACTGSSAKLVLPESSTPVPVVELHRSRLCGTQGEATQIRLFENAAELQASQAAQHPDWFKGPIPELEYALIELGERHTEGYDTLISSHAELRDGILKLTATFLTPPAAAPDEIQMQTAGSINSPCLLIALPKLKLHGLVLLDPSGIERARTHLALAATPVVVPEKAPDAPAAPELPASPAAPEIGATRRPDETAPVNSTTETAPAAPQVQAPPAQ